MRIGLFVPCFIDAFLPEVAVATLELLERFGHEVIYPLDQTCCGQPLANAGFAADAAGAEALFMRTFGRFDCVVAPSGSCVHHVRENMGGSKQTPELLALRARTYELVEFLYDVEQVEALPWAAFPHQIGYHHGCGTLRRLRHAGASETRTGCLSPWRFSTW